MKDFSRFSCWFSESRIFSCRSSVPCQDFCAQLVSLNLALWGYLACFIEETKLTKCCRYLYISCLTFQQTLWKSLKQFSDDFGILWRSLDFKPPSFTTICRTWCRPVVQSSISMQVVPWTWQDWLRSLDATWCNCCAVASVFLTQYSIQVQKAKNRGAVHPLHPLGIPVAQRNSFLAASAGAGMKQNCLPPGGYKGRTGYGRIVKFWLKCRWLMLLVLPLAWHNRLSFFIFFLQIWHLEVCFFVLDEAQRYHLLWKSKRIQQHAASLLVTLGYSKFRAERTTRKHPILVSAALYIDSIDASIRIFLDTDHNNYGTFVSHWHSFLIFLVWRLEGNFVASHSKLMQIDHVFTHHGCG